MNNGVIKIPSWEYDSPQKYNITLFINSNFIYKFYANIVILDDIPDIFEIVRFFKCL